MNEIKRSLKALAVYCLLFAINILPYAEIIPYRFLTENLSSVYLLSLSVCLILRYYLRVAGGKRLKHNMLRLACMIFLFVLLRAIKYSVFGNVSAFGRYTWYLYYVPTLMIPTLLCCISLHVFAVDEAKTAKWCRGLYLIACVLILLVLTNDLHGQVFRFQPGFANWDRDYTRGWGFTLVTTAQYLLYAASIAILVIKCAITKIRHRAWIILLPFAMGAGIMILLLTGTMPRLNGHELVGYPETLCFMAAGVVECCMQLGLIPTNESYGNLMRITSLPVRITDLSGQTAFASEAARNLDPEQLSRPDNTRIGEHTLLRRMDIPGGYGFWADDVTEPDRLNEELEDAKKRLSEEAELIRLDNELREKQAVVEQKTLLYDRIAGATRDASGIISSMAEKGLLSVEPAERGFCRKHICLTAACLKRRSNLMLLSSENDTISIGELGLSVSEALRYLNLYGVPGELIDTAEGRVPTAKALAAFEAFHMLLEASLPGLKGVFVRISGECGRIAFKMAFENMEPSMPRPVTDGLKAAGITVESEWEESNGFFRMILYDGGGTV